MKHIFTIITLLSIYGFSLEAQLPKTEVFSFTISEGKKKRWNLSSPKLLSFDNKNGYNNQPSFIGDDIYITQSAYLSGKEQTDIVALNIADKTKSIVTRTKTSEYSPTPHPDGKHFTVIKQDSDGKQYLVKYALDKKGKGEYLFKSTTNVGYHCWLSDTKVALFLVDESNGHKIVIGDVTTGATKHVAFNVGRCMKKAPNGNLIYLDKQVNDDWKLKTLKVDTGQTIMLGSILEGVEDFELLSDGYIIAAKEGIIHKFYPENGKEWLPIGNLKPYVKNKKVTRIAVKGNRLVVVAE